MLPVRLRLDLRYDGTDFAGWAAQPGLRTVEGTLATALCTLLRVDGGERPHAALGMTVAGRTDAGVHAAGQVCHLDAPQAAWAALPWRSALAPQDALLRRLAGMLPPDLRVHAAAVAPVGFDARFSALCRRYRYRICDAPGGVPPLRRRDVQAHPRPLDVAALDAAGRTLEGLHDFAAFCRRRPNAGTVRTLRSFRWGRDGDGFAVASVVADAFCHSMVRSLVGAVLPVGEGRRPPGWPAEVLAARERSPAVHVVEARGLTLEAVDYPPDDQLAARAEETRRRRA